MKSLLQTKLPHTPESIFSIMSGVAKRTGAINLSQGYPDYPVDTDLIELVRQAMLGEANQYAPMAGVASLREAISKKIRAFHQTEVDPDQEITITTGATQALYTAISAVVHPGDEVVIIEPAYDAYAPSVLVNGGVPRFAAMTVPSYDVDWDAVEAQMSQRTRLIIMNTPHNPTGKCFDDADWTELERIALKYDCLVLSDEVYEHMVYDGRTPDSILSREALRDRSMACYSFGKLCHVTGWKLGHIVGHPSLTQEFRKVHQFVVFSCHHPSQVALATYLSDPRHYQHLHSFLGERRDHLVQHLQDSPFDLTPAEGTYFQLIRYDQKAVDGDDLAFCKWMAARCGVAAIPLSGFYHDGRDDGVLRLCFAKKLETLEDGAARLRAVDIAEFKV